MNKELIINASGEGVEIALLEDKKLVELHYERGQDQFSVGDLYLGKVKKLMPGLNAAFVDVGFEKDEADRRDVTRLTQANLLILRNALSRLIPFNFLLSAFLPFPYLFAFSSINGNQGHWGSVTSCE